MSDHTFPQQIGPFKVTPDPVSGLTSLEVVADGTTRVAVLSADELGRIAVIFEHALEHANRGEVSRISLGEAFKQLIGRDPFTEV